MTVPTCSCENTPKSQINKKYYSHFLGTIRNRERRTAPVFRYSTGVLAPEAVQGFRVLGMNQCASIIEEAMMFFVSPYPRHRNIRNRALDRYEAENDPDLNPFVSLDERFFDLIFEESGGFSSVADAFANEENG